MAFDKKNPFVHFPFNFYPRNVVIILQSLMLNSGFSLWLDAGNMNRYINWFPQVSVKPRASVQTVMNSYDWNRETRKLNIRS